MISNVYGSGAIGLTDAPHGERRLPGECPVRNDVNVLSIDVEEYLSHRHPESSFRNNNGKPSRPESTETCLRSSSCSMLSRSRPPFMLGVGRRVAAASSPEIVAAGHEIGCQSFAIVWCTMCSWSSLP